MSSVSVSVAVVAISLTAAFPAHAQDPAGVPDFVKVAKKVVPSVVTVRTYVRSEDAAKPAEPAVRATAKWLVDPPTERDYPGFRPHGHGSGFFVDAEGEVLTHLAALRVDDERLADIVEVETMDGQKILTEVVGIEPTLQLAVLRCVVFASWAKPSMQPVQFGDSDAVEVGAWLVGVGDPPGPERFLGAGLLCAKPSRDCYQELMSATYMQATMFVPPAAIGGPVVDHEGRVLGILTTLGASPEANLAPGTAWALPAKIVSNLYEAIRAAGTAKSPWLGFSVMSRAEIANARGFQAFQAMKKPAHGIMLENVFDPSPAAAAGLQPGDFLTHFGAVEIHAPVDFQRQLYLAGVGRTIEVVMFRDGETFRRTITVEARPAAAKPR